MGITGLLPFLKKTSREANIKDFRGCTVAIDSYCWLHKGAFSCADKLALGESTDQYVYYCMKYVNSLLSFGLKPIMVFDGARLPSKEGVERERKERRETYRKKAAQLLREGRRAEARECLQRCVDITPTMALNLMNACRAKGVDCIVAPYEADSQLAYLNKVGIAQIIISEDSDLILFGCKKIMYKMDFAGNGVLVDQENLNQAMDLKADVYTFTKFRHMCILSGCDYLPNLPGIGLGKANKLFKLTRQTDMTTVLKKLPTTLKMSQLEVPAEYVAGFLRADNTFLYQLCFDPLTRRQVPLTAYPDHVDPRDLTYAGPYMSKERALQMAYGNLDHYSGKQIADFDPDKSPLKKGLNTPSHMLSIWDPYYRPRKALSGGTERTDCSQLGTTSTKGREVVVKAVTTRRPPPANQLPKRPRDPSPDDGAALRDLAETYAAHAGNDDDDGSGPAPKRRRCEWDEDDGLSSSTSNSTTSSTSKSTSNSTTSPTSNSAGTPTSSSTGTPTSSSASITTSNSTSDTTTSSTSNSECKSASDLTSNSASNTTGHSTINSTSNSMSDSQPPPTSPPRASLREIQPNIESTSPRIREEVDYDTPTVEETSPRMTKNMFAVQKNAKKSRFDLNAGRAAPEVKSRFFTTNTKPLPKTTFFHSLGETLPGGEGKNQAQEAGVEKAEINVVEAEAAAAGVPEAGPFSVATSSANVVVTTTPKNRSTTLLSQITAHGGSGNKSPAKPSPHGSFGFHSKLKMFKSAFDKSSRPSGSPMSMKPFKPVAAVTSKDKENDVICISDCDVTPSGSPRQPAGCDVSTSFRSSSSPRAGTTLTTTKMTSELDSDVISTQGPKEEPRLPSLPSLGAATTKPATPRRSACKSVGLSKSGKATGKPSADKQVHITSFFSQFANKKKS